MLPRAISAVILWIALTSPCLAADDLTRQESEANPLRLIPKNAIALFQCQRPKQAIDQVLGYIDRLELAKFDEVQEFLSSTPYQRFTRYLSYLEKEYARPWGKLLDDLTGNGLTVAVLQPDESKKQAHVLGIIQGKRCSIVEEGLRCRS